MGGRKQAEGDQRGGEKDCWGRIADQSKELEDGCRRCAEIYTAPFHLTTDILATEFRAGWNPWLAWSPSVRSAELRHIAGEGVEVLGVSGGEPGLQPDDEPDRR